MNKMQKMTKGAGSGYETRSRAHISTPGGRSIYALLD